MLYTHTLSIKENSYTFVHSLLITLCIMGFALANYPINCLGHPSSFGIWIHACYFVMLYCVGYTYGPQCACRLLFFVLGIVLFFVSFCWCILHGFSIGESTLAYITLWEQRFPIDIVTAFFLSCITYVISCHWFNAIAQQALANVSVHIFFVCVLQCTPLFYIYPVGNLYGVAIVSISVAAMAHLCPNKPMHYVQHDAVYQVLMLFFYAVCVVTNLLVVKHLHVWGSYVTAALFVYPLTFTLTDVLSELYGHKKTLRVVWGGLFANLVMLCIGWIGSFLPVCHQILERNSRFQQTFGFVQVTIVASMFTYVVAQVLDVHLFDFFRRKMRGRHLWLRNNVATMLSQMVDTWLFAILAWQLWQYCASSSPAFTREVWYHITMNEYLWKVAIALLDTPLVYLLLAICRFFGSYEHKS